MSDVKFSRRSMLQAAALGAAAPLILSRSAKGQTPPSEKVTMGFIGVGWMGGSNLGAFLQEQDCQVVAIADVDAKHRDNAVRQVNNTYANSDCQGYSDFRELLARDDIDAVCISTPDHWHAVAAIAAANAGKDIYCEKPLSHTFSEGEAMVEAVHANQCMWQTGSWQRSQDNFRQGAELVLNGYIGKVRRVEVGLPSGHSDFNKTGSDCPNTEPPAHVDYDMWVGPSDMMPYNACRFHKNWRWNYNFGGGQLMDWIGHHCDIAHWGLSNAKYGIGPEPMIGPLEVSATAEFPPLDATWNTATKYRVECLYPDNIDFIISSGGDGIRGGTKWIGDDGWVYVNRGAFEASDPEWIKDVQQREKDGTLTIALYDSPGHQREFLDSVKTRVETLTPVLIAHRSQTPGHLGYIASLLGRKLHWDIEQQAFVNDHVANRLLSKPLRGDWTL